MSAIDNVIVNPAGGRAQRAEGNTERVVFDNGEDPSRLPTPQPTLSDMRVRDTGILRTRDVALVAPAFRRGLFRLHLRLATTDAGLEARCEYVVTGPADVLTGWLGGGACVGHPVEKSCPHPKGCPGAQPVAMLARTRTCREGQVGGND